MALNDKEIKKLSELLLKIDNPKDGLPQNVFNSLINIIPFISCELIIRTKEGILLTWRNDEYWQGWHIPGGLMRFRDSFDRRIKEVAKIELGVKVKKYKFLFPINYVNCSRGHAVSLVFLCEIDSLPKDGKFFKKMPKNIINEHVETWNKLKKYEFE